MRAPGLSLRFRGASVDAVEPDVAAFARGRAERAAATREGMALLRGAASRPGAPLVVFFRHAEYAIPPVMRAYALPDFADWMLRPVLPGYVAAIPRRGRQRRALWLIAACIPLATLPLEVAAAPSKGKAPIQRPGDSSLVPDPGAAEDEPSADEPSGKKSKSKPPVLPKRNPGEPDPDPDADATPDETDGTDADDGEVPDPDASPSDGEDDTDVPEADRAPGASPPPDPFSGNGKTREQATLDAAWEGVDGHMVEIRLKGGKELQGRVGAVQADTFTLIEADTGVVIVLPKNGVARLRVAVPPELPKSTGNGFLASGIVLTSVGTPVFFTGIAFLAICPSCVGLNVSLLLLGGGAIGIGIPMLVAGTKKRRIYRDALRKRQAVPYVGRAGPTWTGGIRFRF